MVTECRVMQLLFLSNKSNRFYNIYCYSFSFYAKLLCLLYSSFFLVYTSIIFLVCDITVYMLQSLVEYIISKFSRIRFKLYKTTELYHVMLQDYIF